MAKNAALVAVLLCSIIQVAHFPHVWGIEEQLGAGEVNVTVEVKVDDLMDQLRELLQNITNTEEEKQSALECANNVRVIASLVPDVENALKATWSVRDPCSVMTGYRVVFGQSKKPIIVDEITNDTSMTFKMLEGCALHTIEVYALDSDSQIIGLGGFDKSCPETHLPKMGDLWYTTTFFEITVEWPYIDPLCFPDLKYRVTTTGVDTIVAHNHFTINRLACNTSYDVIVSPVDAAGADFGVPASATIRTKAESLSVEVRMTAPEGQALAAMWKPIVSVCTDITGYRVTFSEVGITPKIVNTTEKTYYHYSKLKLSTQYQVRVQPLDSSGQPYLSEATALNTTTAVEYLSLCPFPHVEISSFGSSGTICAVMITSTKALHSIAEGQTFCSNAAYPKRVNGNIYRATATQPNPTLHMDKLVARGYTEKFLVSILAYNGVWNWGVTGQTYTFYTVNSSLMVGAPAGGVGPDDYTMMFMDPAKKYRLTAAKTATEFRAVVCAMMLRA